jgi:hypothetical protein
MPDADFAARLRADAEALRGRLVLPLLCAAACLLRGNDQRRLREGPTRTARHRACRAAATSGRPDAIFPSSMTPGVIDPEPVGDRG